MATKVKYPAIHVRLTGTSIYPLTILGTVTNALREAGVLKEERDAFLAEATAGDYDHLLQTVMA